LRGDELPNAPSGTFVHMNRNSMPVRYKADAFMRWLLDFDAAFINVWRFAT
jgi:hypothetical protein